MFHSHPLPRQGSFAPLSEVWLTAPPSQQENEKKPCSHHPHAGSDVQGVDGDTVPETSTGTGWKKKRFSVTTMTNLVSPWPAAVGTAGQHRMVGEKVAQKEPGMQGRSLLWYLPAPSALLTIICIEQHLLPHGIQDVHPDFMCQGITAALSQGKQTVPAGSTSEQHRACSAKT